MSELRYFSMFTGIGGFEVGLHNAYGGENRIGSSQASRDNENDRKGRIGSPRQNTDSSKRQNSSGTTDPAITRPLCVGYSEIDQHAISVYERHFRGVQNYGDATKINPKDLPDFDLLVGGFPCQSFSIAGKRGGFNDTRGTLFFDIARILDYKRPRHLVLENVKGLLTHDGGKTFSTILKVLADLGYRVEWQLLNSKDFGVPQNRERVYIIGHYRGECGRQVLPLRSKNSSNLISNTVRTGGRGSNTTKHAWDLIDVSYPSRARKFGKYAPTVRNYGSGGNKMPMVTTSPRIRRLTPIECERLQGFPDNWTELGYEWYTDNQGLLHQRPKTTSDTQRYKMCGNAITTNVFEAVIRNFTCLEVEPM